MSCLVQETLDALECLLHGLIVHHLLLALLLLEFLDWPEGEEESFALEHGEVAYFGSTEPTDESLSETHVQRDLHRQGHGQEGILLHVEKPCMSEYVLCLSDKCLHC